MKGKIQKADKSRVAVLDAGGQYVDLVKKAAMRLGYPADVLPLDTPLGKLEGKYQAIIISGSPANPHQTDVPMPDTELWKSKLPILGICYGLQAMVLAGGGKVAQKPIREDGRVTTQVDTTHPLFQGTKADFTGLFTHGVFVTEVPADFSVIGSHHLSDGSTGYSAIAKGNRVGVQFHPEVFDDTPEGYELFRNFFINIAKLQPDEAFHTKQLQSLIEKKRVEIKQKVKGRKVIAFMSGGVDSSVAGALAESVVDLEAFYIDNGFMRDEDEQVIDFLKQHIGMDVKKIDATETFTKATITIDGKTHGPLETVSDPQIKRRIIGKTFIDVQNEIIADFGLKADEVALLQGTNAADRIESGYSTGDSHTETIKTHHNLVPEARELDPIEPLDDLFKDEIRDLGAELGLPEDIVWRQPFPGPALAIRILHARTGKYQLHSEAEQKEVQDYAEKHNLTAMLLPVRSVGVGGDERSHLSAVALQGKTDWETLANLAHGLPSHFRGKINRVVYALSDTPIKDFSVTETSASADVRGQLRHADRIVFEEMRSFDLLRKITQFPVVLLPLGFGKTGSRAIVLRPVATSTFMTVQAMVPGRDLPEEFIQKSTDRILKEVPGISQVLIDLTNKPPGTTEWE
jgi:GMP synthase (glutamine-hydrolysing)